MSIENSDAVVINTIDWRETSAIVTFYTLSEGKLSVVAKGARRRRNQLYDCLQLFSHVNLVFYKKESRNLQVLSRCSVKESFQEIREDLVKTAYACYFVQLVDEMVGSGESSEELFFLLLGVLRLLREESDYETLARFLELHLLRILGYSPALLRCVACKKGIGEKPEKLGLSASAGGVVCGACLVGRSDCISISPGAHKALQHLGRVDLEKLNRLKLPRSVSDELNSAMEYYIEYFAEKELKAKAFLEDTIR